MKSLIDHGAALITSATDRVIKEFSAKFSLVQDSIKGMPYFAYLHKNTSSKKQLFDEKHYFVVPFRLSNSGFALHSIRSLPVDVPEINELPKRRIFHFPNEYAEASLRHVLLEEARLTALQNAVSSRSSLESLADDIDQLDKKMTYGLLAIGGLAVLINPVLGLGIAAKALIPGLIGIASRHGLRPIGERLTRRQLESQIEQAEANVLNSFSESTTLKIINPMLVELELALKTNHIEHDPLLDFDLSTQQIPELESERWRDLTAVAIKNIYEPLLKDSKKHQSAGLGPEDVRWLKVLFS